MTATQLRLAVAVDIVLLISIGLVLVLIIFGYKGYVTCNNTESGVCPNISCENKSITTKCGNYAYRVVDNKTYCSGQN